MPLNLFPDLPQILFLSSLLLVATVQAASSDTIASMISNSYCNCLTDSNFTSNSTYRHNLDLLLPSLTSSAVPTGFATLPKGQSPDQVFGLALCHGDLTQDECQTCLSAASEGVQKLCPLGKSASIWPDQCYLRYSNHNLSSSDDDSFRQYFYRITTTVSEPDRLDNLVGELLNNLTRQAAYASALMFATGEAKFTSLTTLYGMAQCTRDQSKDECYRCLGASFGLMEPGKLGGVVVAYHCYLRFETYAYYNLSFRTAPPSPTAMAASPHPESGAGSSTLRIKERGRKHTAMIIVTPLVGALMVFSTIFIFLWRRKTFLKLFSVHDEENKRMGSLLIDLGELRIATSNFSDANKIGEGGFGPVYKGVLSDGREIAVKRLSAKSQQGLLELRNEVTVISKLQHRNLVRLLGCCLEEEEKLLVYEFLPNKSLDRYLFDPSKRGQLEWGRRYNIIEGIARGLLYLHRDSRLTIIHRDLKTSNILLDHDMSPKISDFGLAKLFEADNTRETASRIAGTWGYMAPEYAIYGHCSTKSDVFSFGVLVLEIVTGRRVTDFQAPGSAANILNQAWKHWNEGRAPSLTDPSLGEQYDGQQASRCVHIGLLCVQEDANKRPSMELVVLMLSSYSITVSIPSTPPFYVQGSTTAEPEAASGNRDPNPPRRNDPNRSKRNFTFGVRKWRDDQ